MPSSISNAEPNATPVNIKALQTATGDGINFSQAVVTPVMTSSASSPKQIMSTLDPMTCSSHEFGQFLLTQRFEGSTSAAIEFLRAVEGTLSSQGRQSLSSKGTEVGNESTVEQEDLGLALTKYQEMSLVTPRAGKFQIALHQKGLFGYKTNSQATQLVIPSGSVSHMIFFPKPEDCRKLSKKTTSADLVLLRFDPAISFQNKSINQVCFQLPFEKTHGALLPIPSEGIKDFDGNCATELWEQVLQNSLANDGNAMVVARANNPSSVRVVSSAAYQFSSYSDPNSSSTTSGMPFVKCYHGVNDGVLYPLQQGLLFFKPPQFIPRSLMHSIACGRGSSSSSRYVDMNVEVDAEGNDDTVDHPSISFSNIQREEMNVLKEYIHDILIPAMKLDAAKSGGEGANTKASRESPEENHGEISDENSEDEEDGNYEDDSSDQDKENDGSDDDEDEDTDDDEGGIEIVEDEMAQELAKKKRMEADNSETESEGEEEPIAKRRRRRIS